MPHFGFQRPHSYLLKQGPMQPGPNLEEFIAVPRLTKQVASAAPIGAAGRPNRGGAYETGSDGAAGGPPGARRVPTGPRRARGDAVGSRMGPYINRAPIRDSRATHRALSGPVVPKQGSDGNPSEPDMTRQAPTGPDGSLDCPVLSTTDIRTHTGPYGTPTCPLGTQRDPT